MIGAGVLNLGFQLVAAREMHPVLYGAFAAVVALINIFLFATDAFRRTVTAVVAAIDRLAPALWVLRRGTAWMLAAGVVAAVVIGLLSHPIAAALRLNQPIWVWIAAVALVPAYTGAVSTGVLQGLRLFRESGGVNLSAAVVKFGVLVALLGLGLGVTGGTIATVTEVTMIWVGGLVVLFGWVLRRQRPEAPAAGPDYRALLALPVTLTIARLLFFNVDILLARVYLAPHAAGLFAGLRVTGSIIAYGTGALPPVIYPYLIRERGNPGLAVRYLSLILAATVVSGGAVIGIFRLAPAAIVGHLFGSDFTAIAPYVVPYGFAYLFYSVAYVLIHYLLAVESWWLWAYALGGGAAEVLGLVLWHADIAQFTWVVFGFFALFLAASGVHVGVDVARRRIRPTGRGAAAPSGA